MRLWAKSGVVATSSFGGQATTLHGNVHVFDRKARLLGRVVVETKAPLDDWIPTKKAVEIINDLQREGRL